MAKRKLFVYGLLRKDLALHDVLNADDQPALIAHAPGFLILDLGGAPGMVPDHELEASSPAVGEVYEVDDKIFPRLDMIEGAYDRTPITVFYPSQEKKVDVADAYIWRYSPEGQRRCRENDWNKRWRSA